LIKGSRKTDRADIQAQGKCTNAHFIFRLKISSNQTILEAKCAECESVQKARFKIDSLKLSTHFLFFDHE